MRFSLSLEGVIQITTFLTGPAELVLLWDSFFGDDTYTAIAFMYGTLFSGQDQVYPGLAVRSNNATDNYD